MDEEEADGYLAVMLFLFLLW